MASSSKFCEVLQSLSQRLEGADLQDPKARQDALAAYLREELAGGPQHHTTTLLLGGEAHNLITQATAFNGKEPESLLALLDKHGLQWNDWAMAVGATAEKPLEKLPCANVEPTKNWRCQENGRMACANCKLVSYCSKVCLLSLFCLLFIYRISIDAYRNVSAVIGVFINKVTSIHICVSIIFSCSSMSDCKDPIRSPSWQPAWIREAREPSFQTTSPGWTIASHEQPFALGMHMCVFYSCLSQCNLTASTDGETYQLWIRSIYPTTKAHPRRPRTLLWHMSVSAAKYISSKV